MGVTKRNLRQSQMVTGKLIRLLLAWGAMMASQVLSEKINEDTQLEETNTDRDTTRMPKKSGSRWQTVLHQLKDGHLSNREEENTGDSTGVHDTKWNEKIESTITNWDTYRDLSEDLNTKNKRKEFNIYDRKRNKDKTTNWHRYPDSSWKDEQYKPQYKAKTANKKIEIDEQKINQKEIKEKSKRPEKYEQKSGSKLNSSKWNNRKPEIRKIKDWLAIKSKQENEQKKGGTKEERHVSTEKKIDKGLGVKIHGTKHHNEKH